MLGKLNFLSPGLLIESSCFLDSPVKEAVCHLLLVYLIPLGLQLLPHVPGEWLSTGSKFGDLVNTAAILAGAGDGSGHEVLCTAVVGWLEIWYQVDFQRLPY